MIVSHSITISCLENVYVLGDTVLSLEGKQTIPFEKQTSFPLMGLHCNLTLSSTTCIGIN